MPIETLRDKDSEDFLRWVEATFIVDIVNGVLIWKTPPKRHPRLLGTVAGHARLNRGKRYWVIKRDRYAVKRAWLIYLAAYLRWPDNLIDHKDGNSENDRIGNLRDATVIENAWNHKKRKRRIDLPMGVRFMEGKYQARLTVNKKQLHLGVFDDAESARQRYLEARKEFYGEFA